AAKRAGCARAPPRRRGALGGALPQARHALGVARRRRPLLVEGGLERGDLGAIGRRVEPHLEPERPRRASALGPAPEMERRGHDERAEEPGQHAACAHRGPPGWALGRAAQALEMRLARRSRCASLGYPARPEPVPCPRRRRRRSPPKRPPPWSAPATGWTTAPTPAS